MHRIFARKIRLPKRLSVVLLIAAFVQVSAAGFAQRITLSKQQVSLENVLKEIHGQSGYDFFFDRNLIGKMPPVSVKVENATLEETLKIVLKDLPLSYNMDGRIIIILKKKDTTLPDKATSLYNPIDVSGKVLSEDNKPLVGATVRIKGSDRIATTNAEGVFNLPGTSEDAILEISYVGFITIEMPVKGLKLTAAEKQPRLIVLRPKDSKLDQVQIVGYGTSSKRLNVGSVTTVSAEEIKDQPVTNVLLALQGRVPGLVINTANGVPGAKAQVQIRGQNTLKSDINGNVSFDQPLFIVDGIPIAAQNDNVNRGQSLASNLNAAGGFSAFNNLNPADIESITVLRDADATSIYGSQGANGVILITTKKGKAGRSELNLSANTSVNTATRQIAMLNTQQYLDMRKEALKNDGIPLPTTYDGFNYPDLLLFDQDKYTNWGKQFFGKTSSNTDVHANYSGGTAYSTFMVSGGVTHSNYNFPGNFADNRLTFRGSFHHNSKDNKLNLDFGSDLAYDHNNSSAQPSAATILQLSPNFPDMVDKAGNLVWNYRGVDLQYYQFYAQLREPYNLKNYSSNTYFKLSYQLLPGLKLSANAGYSRLYADEVSSRPLSTISPAAYIKTSSATFGKSTFQTINIEPQLDYTLNFGKGRLTALVGGTYKKMENTTESYLGVDYPNDALLGSISGATTVTGNSTISPYKYAGVFGRIGYVYDNKYILSLSGRRDGSSNFSPGRQLGDFGSAGLGWIFSEENGFKTLLPFVSYAKLSANYGTTGSDVTAAYGYNAYWATSPYTANFQGIKIYKPYNLFNPDLYSWATKKSLNLALDLGFLQDRILLNATWYRNRESGQLIGSVLPGQTGFGSVTENFAATVQNKGWEFTVTANNIRNKQFSWTTTFNLTVSRNKLIAFPGLESSPYAQTYALGQSTDIVYGYRYKGVNETTGLFEFYKADGTVTSSPDYRHEAQGGDVTVIGDLQPKFYGGMGNTVTYKGWSLSAFFQFSKQDGWNYLFGVYNGAGPGTQNNMPVQVLDHWRNPGDKSSLQRVSTASFGGAELTGQEFAASSGTISDDFYIRLKTLALSYNLSGNYLKKTGIRSARVFVNAQNLLTITNYKAGDPETPGQIFIIPIQRIIAAGLSLNF